MAEQSAEGSEAFLAMEEIVDRLKMLDYELHFPSFRPLTHTYFCLPAANPNEQFFYFMSLASWLMSLLGHVWAAPSQMDDPNSSATSLFAQLQHIGAPTAFGGWQKLKTGYGDPVCSVLLWLLQQIPIEFAPAIHDTQAAAQEEELVEEGDDAADDEMADDIGAADVDEEEYYHGGAGDASGERSERSDVLESAIAPEAWRVELERVTPQLRMQVLSDPKEWRNRLVNARSHLQTLVALGPETNATLEIVSDDLEKTLAALTRAEEKLNIQCQGEVSQYVAQQEELTTRQDAYSRNSEGINTLTNELKQVNEELARVKEKMDARGQSMTDTSPLIKMKSALTKLRSEAKQLDIRIAVTTHTLELKKTNSKGAHSGITGERAYPDDDDLDG